MERYYFYIDEHGAQKGPYTLQQLIKEGIKLSTLVWYESLPDWQRAATIIEIEDMLNPKNDNFSTQSAQNIVNDNKKFDSLYEKVSSGTHTFDECKEEPKPTRPKRWIIEAILVTIFCCMPLGIVGLIISLQSDDAWECGDYFDAIAKSKKAGMWVKIGFFSVLLFIPIMIVLSIVVPSLSMWFSFLMNYLEWI